MAEHKKFQKLVGKPSLDGLNRKERRKAERAQAKDEKRKLQSMIDDRVATVEAMIADTPEAAQAALRERVQTYSAAFIDSLDTMIRRQGHHDAAGEQSNTAVAFQKELVNEGLLDEEKAAIFVNDVKFIARNRFFMRQLNNPALRGKVVNAISDATRPESLSFVVEQEKNRCLAALDKLPDHIAGHVSTELQNAVATTYKETLDMPHTERDNQMHLIDQACENARQKLLKRYKGEIDPSALLEAKDAMVSLVRAMRDKTTSEILHTSLSGLRLVQDPDSKGRG